MVSNYKKSECCGCEACVQVCPQNCIRMEADHEGFLYPSIDQNLCCQCNLCEEICPVHAQAPILKTMKSYAAYNLDADIRAQSSSGGAFWEIAKQFILHKGTVYGVVCSKDEVKHVRAATLEDIKPMMGSKYVQSSLETVYQDVVQDLENHVAVLFTGTPCQVAGLTKYIEHRNADRTQLTTIDMVCHGVPSRKLWKRHLLNIETKHVPQADRISFRDKSKGWRNYSLSVKNGKDAYIADAKNDSYLFAYQNNLTLRPSCYDCMFKFGGKRCADITLADFWGVENEIEALAKEDLGVSWITINTEKGNEIIEQVRNSVWMQAIHNDTGIRHNTSASESARKPKNRDAFMESIFVCDDINAEVLRAAGETGAIGALKRLKRRISHRS